MERMQTSARPYTAAREPAASTLSVAPVHGGRPRQLCQSRLPCRLLLGTPALTQTSLGTDTLHRVYSRRAGRKLTGCRLRPGAGLHASPGTTPPGQVRKAGMHALLQWQARHDNLPAGLVMLGRARLACCRLACGWSGMPWPAANRRGAPGWHGAGQACRGQWPTSGGWAGPQSAPSRQCLQSRARQARQAHLSQGEDACKTSGQAKQVSWPRGPRQGGKARVRRCGCNTGQPAGPLPALPAERSPAADRQALSPQGQHAARRAAFCLPPSLWRMRQLPGSGAVSSPLADASAALPSLTHPLPASQQTLPGPALQLARRTPPAWGAQTCTK